MNDASGLTNLEFSLLVGGGSLAAGFLGSLTGLGGGVIIVPMLTLLFGVDMHYAIGASLLGVIATSSGAAAAFAREGFTNIRLGLLLEVATTVGALAGAYIAIGTSANAIAIVFGLVLAFSAFFSAAGGAEDLPPVAQGGLGGRLGLDSTYPGPEGPRPYGVARVPLGFALLGVAGLLSGLLGIGSGSIKVLAMDRVMRIPFKVSTTTSNFMVGVTAATSAGVYLHRGYINPPLAMPVVLCVLAGAVLGSRLLVRGPVRVLRAIFSVLVFALAAQMIYSGLKGSF